MADDQPRVLVSSSAGLHTSKTDEYLVIPQPHPRYPSQPRTR